MSNIDSAEARAESIRMIRAEMARKRAQSYRDSETCQCFSPCRKGKYMGRWWCKLCGGEILELPDLS